MEQFLSPHSLSSAPLHTPVLLALSGGADSRALLHMLADDAQRRGYTLHLAHVHHGIRGSEADRDLAFCRSLAEQYGCPYHTHHADVPALAKAAGISTEMAGRRVRYQFFARLMRELDIPLLATAHHADDNLETLVLRLVTGSSTTGLGGIAPTQPFESGTLVRPLLPFTREQILKYCVQNHLSYVTDSTNAELTYTRNRIRAEITPALMQLAPHPQRQLLRTCAYVREDDAYLQSLATAAYTAALTPDGALSLEALRSTPPPLLRRLLVHALRQEVREDCRLQGIHLDALLHLIDASHGRVDLPAKRSALADGKTLQFLATPKEEPPPVFPMLPLQEGTYTYPQLGFTLTVERLDPAQAAAAHKISKNPQNVYNPFIHDTLTFDTIDRSAYFRLRAEGDRLLVGGLHRRVRKLQNRCGIPPALREHLPLLCDAQGVRWVPFIGERDGVPSSSPPADAHAVRWCLHLYVTAAASPSPEYP